MQDMLLKLYVKAQNLMKDERGQDMIEYILVGALVALGATAGMTGLANQINTAFGTIGTRLVNATNAPAS